MRDHVSDPPPRSSGYFTLEIVGMSVYNVEDGTTSALVYLC
jgi:hypothetical protein